MLVPAAARAKDSNDKTPLDLALEARRPLPLVQCLFAVHPIDDRRVESLVLNYLLDIHHNPPSSLASFHPAWQNGWVELISTDAILSLSRLIMKIFSLVLKVQTKKLFALGAWPLSALN